MRQTEYFSTRCLEETLRILEKPPKQQEVTLNDLVGFYLLENLNDSIVT